MRYAVGLYDHTMRGVIAERVADRYAVGVKAIGGNLGLADHATAEVVQEIHRAFTVSLADAPANDGLLRSGHADKNVLIALGVDLVALDVLLLLADEGPRLVKFQAVHSNADHQTVVQFHAAKPDTKGESCNRLAVAAGQTRDGALADAFAKGGNDFNLLFAGKVVHEAHPSG